MSDIPRLVFHKPTKDSPGFLQRSLNAAKARTAFEGGDPAPIVEFFLDYETAHPREDARAILLNLSENEFNEVMTDLMDAFEGKANSSAEKSSAKSTARSAPARGRPRPGRLS